MIGLVAVPLLLWFADEYPRLTFRGDGSFSGGPVFGYRIEMRKIPFDVPGEYVFHFHGLPHEEMSLLFYVQGKWGDPEELKHIETTLEAVLTDRNGRVACSAKGMPLKEGSNPHGWVLMSGGPGTAYWHWNCNHMPLKRSAFYTLTVRIRDVDPKTRGINLLPVLEGGQLDWP